MRQKHILKLQINVVSTEDGKMPWGYWLITVDLINEAIACWSQSARYASVGWAQGGEEDAGSEGSLKGEPGGRSVGPAKGRHCSTLKSPANARVCPQLEVGSFGAQVENIWKCPWLGVGQEAGMLSGQGGPWMPARLGWYSEVPGVFGLGVWLGPGFRVTRPSSGGSSSCGLASSWWGSETTCCFGEEMPPNAVSSGLWGAGVGMWV